MVKDIGSNIKSLRESAGMSQEQLAARIGKTRSAVSQYETGKIIPRMGVIEDLASVFRVNKTEIIGGPSYKVVELPREEWTTTDEHELLTLYRQMGASERAVLLETARRFAEFAGEGEKRSGRAAEIAMS